VSASLKPTLLPLGDRALLVRFSETLSEAANRAAIAAARRLERDPPSGVVEIVPGLVSVLVRYTSDTSFARLRGDVGLVLEREAVPWPAVTARRLAIRFDGEDLSDVAGQLNLDPDGFIARHTAASLRVLATGFAPGFVYCGFHEAGLNIGRRETIRPLVPAGTVLFAARQTAIAATPIRTGWHVIGRTTFQNFDASADPPTRLQPGDEIVFEALP
jgi:KipI family sensor histidine kinase inhibitor